MDMRYIHVAIISLITLLTVACSAKEEQQAHSHDMNGHQANNASVHVQSLQTTQADSSKTYEVQRSPEEWKKLLSEEEYRILREAGTEPPFNNQYWDNKREGIYYCAACGQPLYSSKTKYKSGTGWPSF